MPERRTLEFARLDDVMPEVDRLLGGYATAGNWSLGQVCKHLAETMRMSVDGYDFRVPWIFRATAGPVVKRSIFKNRRMMTGIRTAETLVPKADLDDRAETEALRATIAYYRDHPERRVPHPFFGPMTGDEWDRLHLIHSAHHLSFAVPA
jgi:hypothetical protein